MKLLEKRLATNFTVEVWANFILKYQEKETWIWESCRPRRPLLFSLCEEASNSGEATRRARCQPASKDFIQLILLRHILGEARWHWMCPNCTKYIWALFLCDPLTQWTQCLHFPSCMFHLGFCSIMNSSITDTLHRFVWNNSTRCSSHSVRIIYNMTNVW